MISRVSTSGQHAAAIAQLLRRQAELSKTQVQVASGQRIQSPADDPIAATRILATERAQSQLGQYGRNADMAQQRLSHGEQALTDLGGLLDRIRVLALQASNGTMDDGALGAIATEISARADELLQIANRQDGNGEYLYSGYSTTTRPFAPGAAGVTYAGDQGVRQLAISASRSIADGFNGERVFMNVPEGNGYFTVATGVQAGTGSLGVNQLVDTGAWATAQAAAAAVPQPHTYTIRFTDPDADGVADSWEVLDAGGAPVTSGAYTDGATIAFNGAQVVVSGAPAVGDTYTVAPASQESIFKTVDDLVVALRRGSESPQQRALLSSDLNRAVTQLTGAMDHVINLRADIGARLSALDSAAVQREDLGYQLTETLSSLRDLDYAEAISRLNQQAAGLEAAQAAYTRLGQMSLFDYL